MALSSLEKQQEKLNKLNEKIKNEKKKIDNKVGHEIIKLSNLDYSKLTTEKSNDSVSDENINSVHEKTENNF